MSRVDTTLFENEKSIDTLNLYFYAIVNGRKVSCEEQENRLFQGIEDRKRLLLELGIIKNKLDSDDLLYLKYNNYYQEVIDKLNVISLTKAVIPEIKEMIVLLDIACGIKIHLYSAIPSLLNELREENLNEYKRSY